MSSVLYDKYYKKEEYFGKPYKGLIDFFEQYMPKGKVLDLGCGQGRDAIPLALMGYSVMAVDHSVVGVDQLKEKATNINVDIQTKVDDIYSFSIDNTIDIVLLDSMLHFYKNDIEKERKLTNKILCELKLGGLFVNCMIKGKKRETILKDIIKESKDEWEVIEEKYVNYPESKSKYHMIVVKKI